MAGAIDPSERLALQLMQDDLEEFKSLQKGKGRADEPDDFALALQMQSLYLTNQIQSLTDREYCLRIQPQRNTEPLPAPIPKQALPSTAVVAGPSRQARTSAQAGPVIAGSARQPNASNSAGTICKPPVSAVVRSLATASWVDDEASGSTITNDSTPVDEHQDLVCVACDGAYGENLVVRVSCGHVYCPDCLACLFGASTADESLFPPRCCKQPILLDAARKWLPEELIVEFEKKEVEFSSANRTYCSNVNCSVFIPPHEIEAERGYCRACNVWTCTICKSAEHNGACPHDPYKDEILAVAKDNGWQQCPWCQQLVELSHGCNHMSKCNRSLRDCLTNLTDSPVACRCRKEFCYNCGKKWRTCGCGIWNEDRLVQRAEQLVNRGMFGGRTNTDAVRAAQGHIRRTHECFHRSWTFKAGAGRCEECRFHLPSFLFECNGCNIRVCKRCQLNRL
ncbi:hypothetical protein BB8028_0004g04890 [Beauveria bassiana]|uniref:RBR-type E3 ubiquitin transferase n=1 Tax=Beauveria bassiana TaxID=176275 RepID=A0A2S7YBJ6_BEABA|nr:hypothetical protein BB8028_0004g04890 [Beauveria bassiana]